MCISKYRFLDKYNYYMIVSFYLNRKCKILFPATLAHFLQFLLNNVKNQRGALTFWTPWIHPSCRPLPVPYLWAQGGRWAMAVGGRGRSNQVSIRSRLIHCTCCERPGTESLMTSESAGNEHVRGWEGLTTGIDGRVKVRERGRGDLGREGRGE